MFETRQEKLAAVVLKACASAHFRPELTTSAKGLEEIFASDHSQQAE